MDGVAIVEREVRELVRRRGIDPVRDRTGIATLVADVIADYDERSLRGAVPPLADTAAAHKAVVDAVLFARTRKEIEKKLAACEAPFELKDGIEEAAKRRGVSDFVKVLGRHCCLSYATLDEGGQPSQAFRSLFLQETIRRGVLMLSLVVSYAHDDAAIARTLEAVDEALGVYAGALEDGVERFLVGRPSRTVYRRFN